MADYHLSVGQMQKILAHDGPTDIWLLEEDGSITVVPDQPIDEFQDRTTWPKYLARSGSIDNIVLGQGYEPALSFVNHTIDLLIVPRMRPVAAARLVMQALRRKAPQ